MDTLKGRQSLTFITEPALYRLICTSRKPIALEFQRWVFYEVLPEIRRRGAYSLQRSIEELKNSNDDLQAELQRARSRQVIVPAPKQDKAVTISARLVELGYLSASDIGAVYSEALELHKGRLVPCYHPQKKVFVKHLLAISKRLARARRKLFGGLPNVLKTTRTNLYLRTDWVQYGDEVVKDYLDENPINEWNVDFTFWL